MIRRRSRLPATPNTPSGAGSYDVDWSPGESGRLFGNCSALRDFDARPSCRPSCEVLFSISKPAHGSAGAPWYIMRPSCGMRPEMRPAHLRLHSNLTRTCTSCCFPIRIFQLRTPFLRAPISRLQEMSLDAFSHFT
jgi:hypothetical protein